MRTGRPVFQPNHCYAWSRLFEAFVNHKPCLRPLTKTKLTLRWWNRKCKNANSFPGRWTHSLIPPGSPLFRPPGIGSSDWVNDLRHSICICFNSQHFCVEASFKKNKIKIHWSLQFRIVWSSVPRAPSQVYLNMFPIKIRACSSLLGLLMPLV